MGHGEAGSDADREQSEAGGIPQPFQRGSGKGAEGLGSLGAILLHYLPRACALLVGVREEGKKRWIFVSLLRLIDEVPLSIEHCHMEDVGCLLSFDWNNMNNQC